MPYSINLIISSLLLNSKSKFPTFYVFLMIDFIEGKSEKYLFKKVSSALMSTLKMLMKIG